MTTAIIIGGGVIGTACALSLQRRGVAVRLIDPDADWRGASIGNAGLIAVNDCLSNQRRKQQTANPMRARLARTCPGCPSRQGASV